MQTNLIEPQKYNLVGGLPDHNMILIARKLARKKRLAGYFNNNHKALKLDIPLKNLTEFENELMRVSRDEVLQHDQMTERSNKLMSSIGRIIDKFIKLTQNATEKHTAPVAK